MGLCNFTAVMLQLQEALQSAASASAAVQHHGQGAAPSPPLPSGWRRAARSAAAVPPVSASCHE